MTAAQIIAYAVALAIAVATPGPAMIAVVGRGLSQGTRTALAMAGGIAVADLILGALALAGLAALMAHYSWLIAVIKYVGAAYLIYLGIRMWRAPVEIARDRNLAGRRRLLLGMTIGLSNPKAVLFHASLMPLIVDLRSIDRSSAAAILAIIFAVNLAVMGVYAWLAGAGSAWLRTPARWKWLKRIGGGSMLGAGGAIAVQ